MSNVQSMIRRFRYAAAPADIFTDAVAGFVYPKIRSAEVADAVKTYPRSFMTTDHDRFANVRGEKDPSIKFVTDLIGFGGSPAGAGSAVAATDGENGLLFKSVFGTQTKDTGTTITTGATTTSLPCTSAAGITVGGFVGLVIGGAFHVRQVRNKVTNTLTVAPALPSAPANGAVVYASAWYKHAVSGHQHLWFDIEGVDSDGAGASWRRYIRGCLGNLNLRLGEAGGALCEWDFRGSDFLANDGVAQAAPTYPANLPTTGIVMTRSTKVWSGATALVASSLSFNLANEIQGHPSIASPSGQAGYFITGAARTFEMTVLHDDDGDTLFALAQAGGTTDLLIEGTGGGAGNSFVIAAPFVEFTDAKRVSVNGLDAYQLTGQALRADSIAAGFPDVAVAFL